MPAFLCKKNQYAVKGASDKETKKQAVNCTDLLSLSKHHWERSIAGAARQLDLQKFLPDSINNDFFDSHYLIKSFKLNQAAFSFIFCTH